MKPLSDAGLSLLNVFRGACPEPILCTEMVQHRIPAIWQEAVLASFHKLVKRTKQSPVNHQSWRKEVVRIHGMFALSKVDIGGVTGDVKTSLTLM